MSNKVEATFHGLTEDEFKKLQEQSIRMSLTQDHRRPLEEIFDNEL